MHKEIVTEMQNIAYAMGQLDYARQQTLEAIESIHRDTINTMNQMQVELSGIEYNLSRMADALDRLAPPIETTETTEPQQRRGKFEWTP